MTEENIYKDQQILITNLRVVIGEITYSTNNITSVSKVNVINLNVIPPLIGLFLSFLFLYVGYSTGMPDGIAFMALGVIALIASLYFLTKVKSLYSLRIISSSSEIDAISSEDENYINSLVNALNEAIVKKG